MTLSKQLLTRGPSLHCDLCLQVRLVDGEKVFVTQLLCIDGGGCTFKIGEILHNTRACYSFDLALQTIKHSLERLYTSGTMATVAPGKLQPAFFYADKDMAPLNSLCCFANRRQPPPALVTLPPLSTGQGVAPYGHGLGVSQVQRRVSPPFTPQYSIAAGFLTPQALGLAGPPSPHLQHISLQTWPMR